MCQYFLIGHGARLQVDILICQMWGEITTIYWKIFLYLYNSSLESHWLLCNTLHESFMIVTHVDRELLRVVTKLRD